MPDSRLISRASASRSSDAGTGIGRSYGYPADLGCGCCCSSTPRRRRSRPAVACDPQDPRGAARGRGRRDVTAWPRHPPRARRGERQVRRRRGLRRRRHPQRSRRRVGRHRHRALAASRRLDERLRTHARDSARPGRRHHDAARVARAPCVHAARARASRTAGRFLFHTGFGFDAAVIRRVERYGELKRYASHPLHIVAAFETWFRALRPQQAPVRHHPRHGRTDRRRLLRDRVEDVAVHLSRAAAARRRPGSGPPHRPRLDRIPIAEGQHPATRRGSALGVGRYLRTSSAIVQRARPRASCTSADAARSHTRSTATISATSKTSTSITRTTRSRSSFPDAFGERRSPDVMRGRRARRRGRW